MSEGLTAESQDTQYILSLSYGKDSLACLGAIEKLGWPLDRIIHAEVWATDTIPADLPPMVEFKAKADEIIKARWGIEVEHLCATRNGEKLTYEKLFYHVPKRKPGGRFSETSKAGFPYTKGAWCNDRLKTRSLDDIAQGGGRRVPLRHRKLVQEAQRRDLSAGSLYKKEGIGVPASKPEFSRSPLAQGAVTNIVQYLGIAADEPERIVKHDKPGFKMPLVEIGWDEAFCRQWCEANGLLSPIYASATRGGVLVLPQSRDRPASAASAQLPRTMGLAFEVGQRQSRDFSLGWSHRPRLRLPFPDGGRRANSGR